MKALLFTLLLNGFAVNTVFAESSSTMLELDSIEKSLTNDINLSDKRLNKLSRNNTSFSSEELYYFKLLKAHILIMQNKLDQSLKELKQLDGMKTNSAGREGMKDLLVASINHYRGDSVQAFISLDNSLAQLGKIQKKEYEARILINAVGLYKDADLLEFALDYGRRALTLANKLKDSAKICDASFELASIELMTKNYKMAENRLLSAKSYCKKANHKMLALGVDYSILELRIETGSLEEARELAEELHPKMIEYGWDVFISASHTLVATLEFKEENFKLAEKHARTAYNTARKIDDKKRMETSAGLLAEIYSELKDDKKAIKFYKEYMELNAKNKTRIRQRKLAFDIARRGKI